jgi:hypothetical protein
MKTNALTLKPTKVDDESVADNRQRVTEVCPQLPRVETDNVVPFRPGLHSVAQDSSAAGLAELEVENVALRNAAIELMLEIRDLSDRKRRSKNVSAFLST